MLAVRRLALDRDFGGRMQMALRDATHFSGHRRGEQRDLSFLRRLFENPFDVVDEAHAQHFVRFIEHEVLDRCRACNVPRFK